MKSLKLSKRMEQAVELMKQEERSSYVATLIKRKN